MHVLAVGTVALDLTPKRVHPSHHLPKIKTTLIHGTHTPPITHHVSTPTSFLVTEPSTLTVQSRYSVVALGGKRDAVHPLPPHL